MFRDASYNIVQACSGLCISWSLIRRKRPHKLVDRGHSALVIEYNCFRGDTVNAPRTRIPLQSEKYLHEKGKLLDQPQSSLDRVSRSREGGEREHEVD